MAKLKPLIEDDDTTFDSFDMANTGVIQFAKKLPCALIQFAPAFKDLFAFNEELCTQITESIEQNGYDLSHPIQVWVKDDGTPILIDGHHRLAAAKRANLQEIPCVELRFSDEKDALLYAYSQQLDRRNLSDAELLSAIDAFIGIGGKRLNRDAIAERIGVSARTVSKAQAVLKDAGASHEVKENGKTINAAYNDLMDKKHPKAEKKATDKQDGEFADDSAQTDIGSFDDISDALDDTSGEPKAIVIGDHSDHIERPTNKLSAEEDSERTRERRKAYEMGLADGRKENLESLTGSILIKHFGSKIPAKSVRYDATSQKLIIEADEKSQRLILRGDQAEDFIVDEEITVERLIQELSKLAPKSAVKINSMNKAAVHLYYYPDQHITVISDHGFPGDGTPFEIHKPYHGGSPADDSSIDIDGIEIGEGE